MNRLSLAVLVPLLLILNACTDKTISAPPPPPPANVGVERTFAVAGTFTFTCHIHPQMHGTVEVQ